MAYIRKRETNDGPRYDVRYLVNGKRHTDTFRTEKDAKSRLKKVHADELAGLVVDPRGGERLFGEYAQGWLETRLVQGRPLRPMTRQGYEALLRRNIRPHLDRTKLRQITPERVREWYSKVTTEKGSDQAAKSYRLLRAILMTAVADELVPRNPCQIRGGGIEHPAERPMLEAEAVFDLADAIVPRLRAYVLVAGFCTLRPGELLGLQRGDIDLLHGTLHVKREAQEITGQGRVLTDTKTDAGYRSVELPDDTKDELSHHLDAYVAPEPDAYVFTRPSGRPLRRSDLSNAWHAALAAVRIEGVHPHDLRHFAGTTTARMPGITTKELMSRMGHKSPRAALIYQHATQERDRVVADYLEEVISHAKRARKSEVVHLRP